MYNPDEECKAMIATIKRLCKQKSITPYTLAKEAGISTSTISYLVNGKTKPQVYTVLALCNVLGVTMGELFDGKKENAESEIPADESESGVRSVTCEEEWILDSYRRLPVEKRELLRIYVDMLWRYDGELLAEEDDGGRSGEICG